MGVITRFFECKNKNCTAINKSWDNTEYQQEVQNCKTCGRPTKAYRCIHSGRLFGRFKCERKIRGKICGSDWFSGYAYYDTWQKCLKCKNKCKPFYLREHDKSDGVVTKSHLDHLCQKCKELKDDTGNPYARCDRSGPYDYSRDHYFDDDDFEDERYERMLMEEENRKRKAKNKQEKKLREEENKKKQQEKKKEHELREQEAKKKKRANKPADNKENTTSAKKSQKNNQKKEALDDDYWDSDNEEDRENWFYTADEVYLDAPFRLQDYKEKLESGSVKEAPLCEPYRKLYFLHLDNLAAENQSKDKKKKARLMFNNLYSLKIQEVANKKKKLVKKEAVSKTAAKTASKDKTEDNKKKTTSLKKNQKNNQKKDESKDNYLDSDNEEDRANWFYTADEIYLDAPFRLHDYKEKLESGSVKKAPLCEPYRKLYHLYSALLDEKSRPKSTGSALKISTANIRYQNFYSIKIQEAKEMRTASKNNFEDNKENTTSAKTSKSPQNESSLEKKMAALTVSSSQKATRTSTSSRRVLTKLG